MQRKSISRRRFLQGMAVTGLGVAGMQVLAACAAPAPTASQAPSTTGDSAAPAATDASLRIQVAAGDLSIMPTHFADVFTADTGIPVTIEETIY
ncbi:MAG: hypothetical protein HC802_18985, partial [Caldilineaceae bacterium]|nr:hypothetical protein [Caldilineaceae bacterium]